MKELKFISANIPRIPCSQKKIHFEASFNFELNDMQYETRAGSKKVDFLPVFSFYKTRSSIIHIDMHV